MEESPASRNAVDRELDRAEERIAERLRKLEAVDRALYDGENEIVGKLHARTMAAARKAMRALRAYNAGRITGGQFRKAARRLSRLSDKSAIDWKRKPPVGWKPKPAPRSK